MPGQWRRLTVSGAVAMTFLTSCGDAPPDPIVQHVSMTLTDSTSGFGLLARQSPTCSSLKLPCTTALAWLMSTLTSSESPKYVH